MNDKENTPMKMTGNERFNQIYLNSRDIVYRTALYFSNNSAVAEEIMQDTLMELYIRIDDIQEGTEENWLLKVAKHKALNWKTRMLNEKKKIDNLGAGSDELIEKDLEENFLEQERNEEMGKLSEEIFGELRKENENWYEATVRVYGLGKPQREVAKELNVSIEVLHATLYRARRWVKRKYKEKYEKIFGI